MSSHSAPALLSVRDLTVTFDTPRGPVYAVQGVTFDVRAGELLALVGESGSGKSATAKALLGLHSARGATVGGSARLRDLELVGLDERVWTDSVRGTRIGMIFQDPMTALSPVMTVGASISMPLRRHCGMTKQQARSKALELLEAVQIADPKRRIDDYPHQLSGGMRQRVMIAVALGAEPELLVADEPTTALDVTVQDRIMVLLSELRQRLGIGMILVTHDLGVVSDHADHVAVMYGGRTLESGPCEPVLESPHLPYTACLLAAVPRFDTQPGARLASIDGRPPALDTEFSSCAFAERCERKEQRCAAELPPVVEIDRSRSYRCWNPVGVA